MGVTFGKKKLVRLRIETMICKMMHDVMQKLTHFFLFIEGLYKSSFVNIIIENFIE